MSFTTGALLFSSVALQGCSDYSAAPVATSRVVIATSASSVAVSAGSNATVIVHLTRSGGFTGPVTLQLSGIPANVSAEVPANPITGDSAVIALHIGEGVAAGSYALTLSATGTGFHADNASLDLHVTLRTQIQADVAYCNALAPSWVAFQDGDGAWQRAQATSRDGNIHFERLFNSARGAIATLTENPNSRLTVLRVSYGTPAELGIEGDTLRIDCETNARKWEGRVDGLHADEKALVATSQLFRVSVLPIATEFELIGIPSGPQDLLSTRTTLRNGSGVVTGFILRRAIDVNDGSQLTPLDFDSDQSFAPATATLNILGAGNDAVLTISELHTTTSKLAQPVIAEQSGLGTRDYWGIPADKLLPGDLQLLHLSTASGVSSRTADVYYRTVADRTVTLGARITPPTLGLEQSVGVLRPRALMGAFADYDQLASIVFTQAGVNALVSVSMTPAYASTASGGFDMSVPDFTGVAGFNQEWALRPGIDIDWGVTRIGGTVPLRRGSVPSVGAQRRTAGISGTFLVR